MRKGRRVFNSIKLVLISFTVAAIALFAYHQLFHARSQADVHADETGPVELPREGQRNASD